MTIGPQNLFSDHLHATKYRNSGESFQQAMARIAYTLKDSDEHYEHCKDILYEMRFAPAGRIQAAVGSPKQVTPYNCFVSGTIEDKFNGNGSIMDRAAEASITMRLGGGIGYDFSTLRPKGWLIRKLQSQSSGPVSFMDIYNAIGVCISSAGHRRGAQMGVMRIDHPDVEEFVHAKQNVHRLTGFNISLAITNEFMECLSYDKPFALKWQGETVREVDSSALWDSIMRSTWDWAEPGVLFIDTINNKNNLYYCETIAATNPCGEQPLPPFGACLLGSFNLTKYVKKVATWVPGKNNYFPNDYTFDYKQFEEDIPAIVRMMDNIIDKASYPLQQQRMEALKKRRMGLGIMGLANAAEILGLEYASSEFLDFQLQILETLAQQSYKTSIHLAIEKGPFPLFDSELYCEGEFIKSLPVEIRADIKKHGIRNSHLTSIAPTGTIAFCHDYISSGIEPVFEYESSRIVNMPEGSITVPVKDYAYDRYKVRGKLSKDVTAQEHVDVLAAASILVDSAVSKTCNVNGAMPWDQFKNLYANAWERECKGITTFNAQGKRIGILNTATNKIEVCEINDETGERDCG